MCLNQLQGNINLGPHNALVLANQNLNQVGDALI